MRVRSCILARRCRLALENDFDADFGIGQGALVTLLPQRSPLLPDVPDAARGEHAQLWPHRHGTDAMFMALLRRTR